MRAVGQALDQAVEERLGLGVDPVEVLEDHRSGCTWLSRRSSRLTASSVRWRRCGGIERLPLASSTGTSRSAQERRQGRLEGASSVRSLPVTFSRISALVVALLDLEVALSRSMTGRYGVALP